MNVAFGTGDVIDPVNRRGTKPAGFSLLNRLNTSPIASTLAWPRSGNARETRRFICWNRYPRPQFQVLHGPVSVGCDGLSGLYVNARSGMSLFVKSLFRSSPCVVAT